MVDHQGHDDVDTLVTCVNGLRGIGNQVRLIFDTVCAYVLSLGRKIEIKMAAWRWLGWVGLVQHLLV